MNSFSDVLSAIAIVVAGLALLQASQAQRENKKLQRENIKLQARMVQIEEARDRDRLIEGRTAKLIAKVVRGTMPREPSSLVIENKGQSEARDIEISINGEPIASYSGVRYRPMSVIPAEESFSFGVYSHSDMPDYFRIKMTWTDNSGELRLFEATLST